MAYTLSQLLSDTMLRLGRLKITTATGGSTATAIDTSIIGLDNDDDWNGGYLFVLQTTGGLAPQGEYQKITDYVASTGTFTTGTFTAAIGAGDRIGYSTPNEYPVDTMISLANLALSGLGEIALVDTTTLDTVDNQNEYAAAVAWKRRKPFQVDIQTEKITGNNGWDEVPFDWVPAAPGATGLIQLRNTYPGGNDVRVWYDGVHPDLTVYSSVISETIPPELIRAILYEKALEWQNMTLGGTNAFMKQVWERATGELQRIKNEFKIWKPKRSSNILNIGEL
jgi:hypothetical protein